MLILIYNNNNNVFSYMNYYYKYNQFLDGLINYNNNIT
jgi:hypothetical protein